MGILSAFLLCAWPVARLRGQARRVLLVALLVATLWGPSGVPLLGYVRAVFGDLSVPTVFLLLVRVAGGRVPRTRATLLACAAPMAILYFPPALGACRFQPYAWGYGSPGLLVGVLALSAALWVARRQAASAVLMAASVAWQLRLGESTNLWDYLLDPLLAGAGVVWAVRSRFPRAPSASTARSS
jgi:hypothetical protein